MEDCGSEKWVSGEEVNCHCISLSLCLWSVSDFANRMLPKYGAMGTKAPPPDSVVTSGSALSTVSTRSYIVSAVLYGGSQQRSAADAELSHLVSSSFSR